MDRTILLFRCDCLFRVICIACLILFSLNGAKFEAIDKMIRIFLSAYLYVKAQSGVMDEETTISL